MAILENRLEKTIVPNPGLVAKKVRRVGNPSVSVPLRTDANECRDAFNTKIIGRLCSLEDQVLLLCMLSLRKRRNVSFSRNN